MKNDLIKARALIVNGWLQGNMAVNYLNEPVDARSPDACSFCIAGALLRVTCDDGPFYQATQHIRQYTDNRPVTAFNDDPRTTRADVLRVLDAAIADAK